MIALRLTTLKLTNAFHLSTTAYESLDMLLSRYVTVLRNPAFRKSISGWKAYIRVLPTRHRHLPGQFQRSRYLYARTPGCFLIVAVRHSPEAHEKTAMQPQDLLPQS
jgi:hypothetical protein